MGRGGLGVTLPLDGKTPDGFPAEGGRKISLYFQVYLGVNFRYENPPAHAPLSSLRTPLGAFAAGDSHLPTVQIGALGHPPAHAPRAAP